MDALELLSRVTETYLTTPRYSDTGAAEVVRSDQSTSRRSVFSTAFVRQEEYYSYTFEDLVTPDVPLRGFLRSTADETILSCFGEVETVESLGVGVAGMGGGTCNVAYVIPVLLMPDVVGRWFWQVTELRAPRLMGEDLVTGARCATVAGVHPWNDEYSVTLFVDTRTHFLRRVDRRSHFDGVEESATITYEPQGGA